MSTVSFGLILSGVLLNAAAQLLLKAGANKVGAFAFTLDNAVPMAIRLVLQPSILAGLACYAVSVVVWVMALTRVPVSIAYPMLSIGYVVNALLAWWLFGEALGGQKMLAILIILFGVWLLARS